MDVCGSTGFLRSAAYRALLQPSGGAVRETGPDSHTPFSERHLQCVWYDPALLPRTLRSQSGETVRIEDAGRWNLEAGPDFLDAVLVATPGNRRLVGDVEIHVRAEDWQHHGHTSDPRYANVIAHVTYFHGTLPDGVLAPGALQLSLCDALKAIPSFSFEIVDLTAYPFAVPGAPPRPCAALLSDWPAADRVALLQSAGEERLRRKSQRMRSAIRERGPDQVLYEELMLALGYKKNQRPFARLARILPFDSLQSECGHDPLRAYALLLGVAGLLPSAVAADWDEETRVFVRLLWDHWWKQKAQWEPLAMQAPEWSLSGLRPQNHPARRLAAAAGFATREANLSEAIRHLDIDDPGAWMREVTDRIQSCDSIGYWLHRLGFGGSARVSRTAIVGPSRAAAMITNVIIPFLAARDRGVDRLLPHLPAEGDNAVVRQAASALFGRDQNPELYRDSLCRQGLMQIFYDFCVGNRSGCRDCAFTDALRDARPAASVSESGTA